MFIASATDQRPGAPKRKRERVKGRQKEEERETDGGEEGFKSGHNSSLSLSL